MLISMTGFGKAVKKAAFGLLQIEIQAVNSRNLLIKTNIPRSLSAYDQSIKKMISEKVERGTIFVSVSISSIEGSKSLVQANLPLAKAYLSEYKKVTKALKLPVDNHQLSSYILQQHGLFVVAEPTPKSEKVILQVLADAMKALITCKKQEGLELAKDIKQRLMSIQQKLVRLKSLEKKQPQKVAEKLNATLTELKQNPDEERFVKEIALLADKANISEEVTRLESHIKQMLALISTSTNAVGKKLEFFAAELFRETNTISQKALFQEMIEICIDAKTEIEKIKEQLANVE